MGILRTDDQAFLRDRLLVKDGAMKQVNALNHRQSELMREVERIKAQAKQVERPLTDAEKASTRELSKRAKAVALERKKLLKQEETRHADMFSQLANPDDLSPFPGRVERKNGEHRFSMVLAPSSMVVIVVSN